MPTRSSHGTEEQRCKYVSKLASGEWIGCMGLTEPGAGSDMAALKMGADRRGAGYVLNGTKMFITNGSLADVAVIFARTNPEGEHTGISAFIVERGTPGFSAGRDLHKMGMRSSVTSELVFEDCVVPRENLLGEEEAGFRFALQTVEWDRCTLIAPFIGQMEFLVERCCRYAKHRHQFDPHPMRRRVERLRIGSPFASLNSVMALPARVPTLSRLPTQIHPSTDWWKERRCGPE